jgi:hypothetical protein
LSYVRLRFGSASVASAASEGGKAQPAQHRVITLPLDPGDTRGSWRKKLGGGGRGGERYIRLVGWEIVFEHPESLLSPLTIAAGMVAVAVTDHGGADEAGRFPHPATAEPDRRRATLPGSGGVAVDGRIRVGASDAGRRKPESALVFIKPLEPDVVEAVFRPQFVAALAQRSALGAPTVFGLLARVTDVVAADEAFMQLGVSDVVTDREVAPAQRRHFRPTGPPRRSSGRWRTGGGLAPSAHPEPTRAGGR